MKKILMVFSVVLLTLGMASCSKGYDLNKCKELEEKMDSGSDLTQDEYAEIIAQAQGLLKYTSAQMDKLAAMDDAQEIIKFSEEEGKKDENKYSMKFHQYLTFAASANVFDEKNQKAYEAYMAEFEKASKKGFEVGEKVGKAMAGKALDAVSDASDDVKDAIGDAAEDIMDAFGE